MIPDSKIDSLDDQLDNFRLNEQTRQNDLRQLIKDYDQVLKDYRVLKQADDQRRFGSAQRDQDLYVLLLVDGNEYVFNEELVRDKEEGGMRAARLLNQSIERQLHQVASRIRSPRIVISVFADFVRLSKQLAQAKLIGFDKRSVAPFAAGFTRAFGFTSFIDTLDEEGTKMKIREQFKAAASDGSCDHIFFAACHDSAYLSSLAPYSGAQEKITLVQGAGWRPEFHQFSLNVTQFPAVFRWSELRPLTPNGKATASTSTITKTVSEAPRAKQHATRILSHIDPRHSENWRKSSSNGNSNTPTLIEVEQSSSRVPSVSGHEVESIIDGGAPSVKTNKTVKPPSVVCRLFHKGLCSYGDRCKWGHVLEEPSQSPDLMPDVINDRVSDFVISQASSSSGKRIVSNYLPSYVEPGYIPINRDHQRVDTYIAPPTSEEWKIYNDRFRKQRPCNDHHLQGVCKAENCQFDHEELEPEAGHVLEYVLKCNPCPRKGACRKALCYYGHLCQKDGCVGNMKGCRMKRDLHNVDPVMSGTVPAEDEMLVHGLGSGLSADETMEMEDETVRSDLMW